MLPTAITDHYLLYKQRNVKLVIFSLLFLVCYESKSMCRSACRRAPFNLVFLYTQTTPQAFRFYSLLMPTDAKLREYWSWKYLSQQMRATLWTALELPDGQIVRQRRRDTSWLFVLHRAAHKPVWLSSSSSSSSASGGDQRRVKF